MSLTLAYYPAFEDATAFNDRFWRAVHYFGPVADVIKSVEFAGHSREPAAPPDYFDQTLPARAAAIKQRLRWVAMPRLEGADLVIVWDQSSAGDAALRGARKVAVLDPMGLHEGDLAIELGASLQPRSAEARALAQARLAGALASEQRAIAHAFGAGPSLAGLGEIESGVSIVCNSLVKDEALLARLRPRFITAIDPIFHAGPSRHAGAFRAQLYKMLETYRAWFVVQERDAHIYEALLPPHLRELMIPIPVRYGLSPNFDLARRFWLTATRNVLTLSLLPLAGALAREVRLYGCDGRPVDDRQEFWPYAPGAAFDAELALQRQAHPGFFTLDYQDYYALHCETTRLWVGAMERRGLKVGAATASFIPALASRRLAGVEALPPPPASFALQARAAYWRRSAQSAYGAVLAAPAAPGWLKRGLRAAVRVFRP
jgi:hypothetical protein